MPDRIIQETLTLITTMQNCYAKSDAILPDFMQKHFLLVAKRLILKTVLYYVLQRSISSKHV